MNASAIEGSAAPAKKRKVSRVIFVDLLRLLASFQMLHGHTIDALLAQELRQGPIFSTWSWQRGLVSVGFLFAAGIAFTLSTLGDLAKWKATPGRPAKRWRRIAWLIFLGYSMHFPAEAWSSDPARAEASIHAFMIADVLQCIGVSIAVVQIIAHFAKRARTVVVAAACLSLTFFFLAPLADSVEPSGWARPFLNYLSHKGGSLFPLFPWSGFVFAGVAASAFVAPQGARTDARTPPPRLFALAVALFAAWGIARGVPFTFVSESTTSHAVPSFVLLKLASVVAVVVVLSLIGLRVRALPKFLQKLAGESLMLYWFHLMVLYGAGIGLGSTIGRTLSFGQTMFAAASMVVVACFVGLGWNRLKAWNRERKAPKLNELNGPQMSGTEGRKGG
ncbi:MAG: heparan-alpha-glucosaminide N-acetyltransferase domain-containing protein [Myxococcota bacterium]